MSELIEKALQTATETKDIIFGDDVNKEAGPLFARLYPGQKVLVVADENTYDAVGDTVVESLRSAGVEFADEPYIFPGKPTLYAGYDNVIKLREIMRPYENTIVLSIGGGTLNDIAKLASGELGREYINVCTAASVDGFCSFGASISKDGFKITRNCPAPAGLVMDIETMMKAPYRLTATGYGDLIEKIPAGADWILSEELGIEPIDEYVWGLVQGPLMDSLGDPQAVRECDHDAIAKLGEGQLMSGLAMQAHQSSRPASGAGHQFSHVWEMEGHGLDWEPPLSHGNKVGVGTVASLAIWEEFLKLTEEDFDADRAVAAQKSAEETEAEVRALLIPTIAEEAVKHSVGKLLAEDELRARIALLKEKWPVIKARCEEQNIPAQQAWDMLKTAGAPYHPEMLKIDWDRFRETHVKAQMIRPRYTVLDILKDLGLFDVVIDKLFSEEGFWGRHRHPDAE
ncbi:sn-glycerol-1-phosphate dehydrogenase [Trueperella pecoris]|uniref:sn-glycerol-1-phosphate dehydrogenase n=1 Tax=Trueperella pecoris TaxID=2733571 RepID=A0A7M1R3J5_9ACTO|nr:sn-glycerol-1-phosphate dehydrogenase [Trueperella pecoris]QOR48035.1 sn-glycerol-1-phosphate dehydrogenase [Trueperella pecoris]